jgi:hypothetical protein
VLHSHRSGELFVGGELAGALLCEAEELGDVNEAENTGLLIYTSPWKVRAKCLVLLLKSRTVWMPLLLALRPDRSATRR